MKDKTFNEPRIALNRIYTRLGDHGSTSLTGGQRTSKDDLRIEAYGTVDELNAFLVCARVSLDHLALEFPTLERLSAIVHRVQHELFNLGSILSVIGIPGRSPYAASKGGLLNLSRVMALEWAPHGVTVNTLCPGPFATDMNKPLLEDPEKYQAFVRNIPMGRWGELHEIAPTAVFLCSDAGSFVTGSALFVDGGWTAQ